MSPQAVLFDFDGVIADTENVHVVAWQRTLARMGWELADEAAAASAEVDDRTFLRELFSRREIQGPDLDGWLRREQDLAEALLADAPRAYPGVADLAGALRSAGVRLAVVSGTWRRNVEVVLESSGLTALFETIVAKEDVDHPKPAPDGYLLALSRLGLAPGRAIAIEDSPTGLESARAAGLAVVAVGHRRGPGDWSEGARFLPDFASTPAALEALGV